MASRQSERLRLKDLNRADHRAESNFEVPEEKTMVIDQPVNAVSQNFEGDRREPEKREPAVSVQDLSEFVGDIAPSDFWRSSGSGSSGSPRRGGSEMKRKVEAERSEPCGSPCGVKL